MPGCGRGRRLNAQSINRSSRGSNRSDKSTIPLSKNDLAISRPRRAAPRLSNTVDIFWGSGFPAAIQLAQSPHRAPHQEISAGLDVILQYRLGNSSQSNAKETPSAHRLRQRPVKQGG
jgi:hypothetical protein